MHFWHFTLIMYGFCQFIPNSKLSSIFISTYVRADHNNSNDKSVSILLMSVCMCVCVFGGWSLWWRRVVIPVDIQRVHHFSATEFAGMMNHVYLQELQSGPSHVASSTHSVLGWVTLLQDFCTITTKGFTSQCSLVFHPLPLSVCQVSYISVVIPWSFI